MANASAATTHRASTATSAWRDTMETPGILSLYVVVVPISYLVTRLFVARKLWVATGQSRVVFGT